MQRTEILKTKENIGKEVLLQGWVETVRDHGKVSFIMLKDRTASVQCVTTSSVAGITEGSVIQITGMVKERPEKMANKNLATGTVEIEVTDIKMLNKSKELPSPINTAGLDINEEMRLKYRYLDLRRNRLQKILKLRSDFNAALRQEILKEEFTEVETPLLSKATMEGARDFIVPSRYNPGKFYALPQSPQQYKQLLMTAGVEKYYQFARCIRDEDLRADRGYEFTQLDIEMSFVQEEEVRNLVEKVVINAVKAVGGKIKDEPFPRITYKDAIAKYGADKFDMRTEQEKKENVLAFAWVIDFPFFKKTEDEYEKNDGKSGWVFTHNPFGRPKDEHLEWQMKGEHIGEIISQQYDLVCNGFELGSGCIRAHEPELLRATYKIMGYNEEETNKSIGHMLEAFELGTPPHGGFAIGLDRLMMLLANEKSLKEIIAFPMTATGKTSVMDAPSTVSREELKVLHLEVKYKGEYVNQDIKKLLDSMDIKYQALEHEEARTSEEAAKVRGTKLSEGAKAMVVKSKKYSGKYAMIVVPADLQLDMNKVKEVLNEEYEIANAKDVEDITGVKVGGVPPFGRLFRMELYFDKKMYDKERVAFNCGRKDRSIIMTGKDLIKAAQPNDISQSSTFTI